jgi:hypothetical protein
MENQTHKTAFPKKWVVAWFAIFTLASALAACGNKGGGGNNTAPITPACVSCTAITPATLVTATSKTPFQAAWVFNGDLNTINSTRAASPYANLYEVYNGSVTVTGTITLAAPLTLGGQWMMPSCVVPAGTYTITTTNIGTSNYAVYNVPQMSATNGSTVITFSVSNGVFYTFDGTNVLASGNMNLTTLNGAACSGTIYFN